LQAGNASWILFNDFSETTEMKYEAIIESRRDAVGIISLNRPERMNAVSEEMYLELQDALEAFRVDEAIRPVIVTGSVRVKDGVEKQAFCAGADLKKHSSGERTHRDKRKYIELAHETTRRIHEFPKPVIAAVNGPARGAGAELALACDFIFMADGASLAFPETGLGTFVGGGVTLHLTRTVGLMRAKELIYTGKVVDAATAVEIGLALSRLPVKELMDAALAFAGTMAGKAPISMAMAKEFLQEGQRRDLATILKLETDAILSCMDTEDWQEGVDSFAQKRKPVYKGR
jgi:enoyl-CoA hydratase